MGVNDGFGPAPPRSFCIIQARRNPARLPRSGGQRSVGRFPGQFISRNTVAKTAHLPEANWGHLSPSNHLEGFCCSTPTETGAGGRPEDVDCVNHLQSGQSNNLSRRQGKHEDGKQSRSFAKPQASGRTYRLIWEASPTS